METHPGNHVTPSRWVIATDEAGYGPKLGPLVIVGTLWQIRDPTLSLEQCFEPYRQGVPVGDSRVVIDDSKRVFNSSKRESLNQLRTVAWYVIKRSGWEWTNLSQGIQELAPDDAADIAATEWMETFEDVWESERDAPVNDVLETAWSDAASVLVASSARIILPSRFNSECESGWNKSDILSRGTLRLVQCLVRRASELSGEGECRIEVRCDRHGGRRYYAAVIQDAYPDGRLSVIAESSQSSVYSLATESAQINIGFTVQGDSFPPVAVSSLVAKYLREQSMNAFNRFFASRWKQPTALKPTAGYPVDADRFLTEVQQCVIDERIDLADLVRSR